ncbi:hypothetical protein [Paracidovorax avenae]|nr:hypothetical protein [Paracidovorax avenae]
MEKLKNGSGMHKGRRILVVFVLMCLGAGYLLWRLIPGTFAFAHGFQSQEMAAVQYADQTVRANLGGIFVAIPSYFVEYLEYDGDPGWRDKGRARPVRTLDSKIASFGFDVRYPDMAGKSTPELWGDYRKRKLSDSQWIRVVLISGEIYPGLYSTDRLARQNIDSNPGAGMGKYEKLSKNQHGLEVYAFAGVNPKNGKPYRELPHADDVFVKRNGEDRVVTFIKCSNRQVPSAPCSQYFDLEPEMHVSVTVSYRRGLISDWQGIQESVKKTVLGFSVTGRY